MSLTPKAASHKELDRWATKLAVACDRASARRTNETELREDIDRVVRDAAEALYGLSDRDVTAERRASKGKSRKRYDKAYGGLVVEWEWDMGAARKRVGAQQALDYLGAMREEMGLEGAFTAVVTDGKEWGFLASDRRDPQLSLLDRQLTPDEHFQWHANSPAACRRFLVLLGSNQQRPVTSAGLADAFGPDSVGARRAVALLIEALAARDADDRADTLYREWRRSIEVVYGNLDDEHGEMALRIRELFDIGAVRSLGELLFAVHTYFALIVRLVAIEVLGIAAQDERSRPTLWSSLGDAEFVDALRAVDAGEIPNGLQIQNLFESDVFSWYRDALASNVDLLNAIRGTLDALQEFALPRVAYGAGHGTDILRDLYRVLVPRELRKALGEFMTPIWLAQACLERLREVGADIDEGRVLDPTCGTGTFLLPVLHARVARLRTLHGDHIPKDAVADVLNSVVGFDINPVAVTAARANFVIALGDVATAGDLTLPIWRADSILVPDDAPVQTTTDFPRLIGQSWQALRTSLPDPFPVPTALATARHMAQLRTILERSLLERDAEASEACFVEEFDRAFGPGGAEPLDIEETEFEGARIVATELQARIRELRDSERNGVWARIIENNFAPLFAGKFDVVVGNPPWLTWTKTPEAWRAAGETLWKRYGLWRVPDDEDGRGSSLASGDVAILVFALALHRYAELGGTVGLLVPRSLVNGDPGGRAFRQFRLRAADVDRYNSGSPVDLHFRMLAADDWSPVKPFAPDAANTPVFLAASTGATNRYPVPTNRWERIRPRVQLGAEWSEVRANLRRVSGLSNPVNRQVRTSAWSFQADHAPPLLEGGSNRWTFGKGLDTRGANGVYFVEILNRDNPQQRILIENLPKAGRNRDVRAVAGWVEADLVQPLLRGKDVRAWLADPSGYVVAPYDLDGGGVLLSETELKRSYPAAWRWLRRHLPTLKSRKPPPTRSWDLAGSDWYRLDGPISHMGFGNIVVVREQQKRPAAAIVPTKFDEALGRTATAFVDHKLVFCSVDSPDEAVYLTTVINATTMQDLLASFSNEIAVAPKTLSRLPIPDFDPVKHGRVVEAGREAIKAVSAGKVVDQYAVDSAVAGALGLPSPAPPVPQHQPVAAMDQSLPGVA